MKNKPMKRSFTILATILLLSTNKLSSQNPLDSLSGFDEGAAIRASISENFNGHELKVHLNQLKRKYINDKFSLRKEPAYNYYASFKPPVGAACVNEDFEADTTAMITSIIQISGWTTSRGYNTNGNNNCNLNGCCPSNPSESSLISAPSGYIDPVLGSFYPIYSVFGSAPANTNAAVVNPQITSTMYGNNFIRINSDVAGDYSLERISKTFAVSSSNALFRFAFIAVQSSGHMCCDAGGFILKITNVTTNTFLSSVSYSASGVSASCTSTLGINYINAQSGTPATTSSSIIFNKWHLNYIDLTPYIGQNINIEVTAGDCTAGGHYGYAYFDSQCGPLEIEVNGLNKNTSCSASATVSAPANLGSYQWNGPSGFSSTSQSFTTSTAGIYSLTILQSPPYQSIQKTLNLIISPASVSLSLSKPSICAGEKVVITASGLNNYSWSNGGSAPSITVNPNSTTTYTLTGTNIDNCQGFAMTTVSVNACTGIEKTTAATEVILFPNPNNGEFELNINKLSAQGEIIIKNSIGQVVYSQVILKRENKIKTKGLASGVYYYSVTENARTITAGKLSIE